jgi:hypothetical protein
LMSPLSRKLSMASTAARPRVASSSGAGRAIGRFPRAITNSSPRSTFAKSSERRAFASATFMVAGVGASWDGAAIQRPSRQKDRGRKSWSRS